jgi:hypothetical protein
LDVLTREDKYDESDDGLGRLDLVGPVINLYACHRTGIPVACCLLPAACRLLPVALVYRAGIPKLSEIKAMMCRDILMTSAFCRDSAKISGFLHSEFFQFSVSLELVHRLSARGGNGSLRSIHVQRR